MSTNWIPSSMSMHLHPHLRLLQETGLSIEQELERDDLPVDLIDRPDIRYATRLVGRFILRMERREGIPDLCYLGARCDTLASMLPAARDFLGVAGTLKEFLDRYAFGIRRYNGRLVSLSVRGKTATLCTNPPVSEPDTPHQRYSDWSNIHTTILLMREALGRSWTPDEITLQARFRLQDQVHADFPKTTILTGQKNTAIRFPRRDLSVRMPAWRQWLRNSHDAEGDFPEAGPFPNTLAAILRPYLSHENLSVKLAAETAGTSVRSLQRVLGRYGMSYSSLVQRERIDAARNLLLMPGASITDIAYQLGFQNPTHFSRAFRRWTGLSPREFRRENVSLRC